MKSLLISPTPDLQALEDAINQLLDDPAKSVFDVQYTAFSHAGKIMYSALVLYTDAPSQSPDSEASHPQRCCNPVRTESEGTPVGSPDSESISGPPLNEPTGIHGPPSAAGRNQVSSKSPNGAIGRGASTSVGDTHSPARRKPLNSPFKRSPKRRTPANRTRR